MPKAGPSRTSPPRAASDTCRRDTACPSATSTGTATRTCSSRWGGAYQADQAYSALYLNPGNTNHWLTLELEGVRTNRKGIGARIEVALETGSGPRRLYRSVGSGGSFGASPLRQEIGLGDALRVESVEILWPVTGVTQTLRGLDLDRHYRVREGVEGAVQVEPRPPAPTP
jgi:hypothetical protein